MPTYYTVREIAAELKVTERAVYGWLSEGRLHGLRAGRVWRIPAEDLDAFLRGRQPGKTTEEAKAEG